ncbi:MAG: hypothetical protein JWM76_3904 [Pseudonocardiales bacterium]|nr:hypothetical protein [Pseudonocardiales bacterium]
MVASADLTPPLVLEPEVALRLLQNGEITVEGQVMDASNATLYVRVELDGLGAAAAYKPVSGERPLWDFPDGTLAEREVAAFTVSQAAGGNLIPPTVLREGPFGIGMVQLWIQSEDSMDIRHLLRAGGPELRRVALLDAVINNGDRKGGHLLPTSTGHVYGIDHGVSFNVDEKLRTVLWNWAGDGLTDDEIENLEQLRTCFDDRLADELEELLTRAEVRRTRHRIERLLRTGTLPMPSRDWPPVPWPAM